MIKALGLSPNHPLFTEKDKVRINIYLWEMANNVDGWMVMGEKDWKIIGNEIYEKGMQFDLR